MVLPIVLHPSFYHSCPEISISRTNGHTKQGLSRTHHQGKKAVLGKWLRRNKMSKLDERLATLSLEMKHVGADHRMSTAELNYKAGVPNSIQNLVTRPTKQGERDPRWVFHNDQGSHSQRVLQTKTVENRRHQLSELYCCAFASHSIAFIKTTQIWWKIQRL